MPGAAMCGHPAMVRMSISTSAAIAGGLLSIGSNALVRSHAGSGLSVI